MPDSANRPRPSRRRLGEDPEVTPKIVDDTDSFSGGVRVEPERYPETDDDETDEGLRATEEALREAAEAPLSDSRVESVPVFDRGNSEWPD